MKQMSKAEIIATLHKLGWRRRNWRWYNLNPAAPAHKGLTLREAASMECLLAGESLTEPPSLPSLPRVQGNNPFELPPPLPMVAVMGPPKRRTALDYMEEALVEVKQAMEVTSKLGNTPLHSKLNDVRISIQNAMVVYGSTV